MKETSFVSQNRGKWEELEAQLAGENKDPEKISRLFIQVTDDLSYAQTFYKNRSVRVYLNGIAQQLFSSVYRSSRFRFSMVVEFWKIQLPVLIYKTRREFLIVFLFFLASVILGAVSTRHDPGFAKSILGEEYVKKTIENIQNNDPMGIYKSGNSFNMFLGITVNNLYVAFVTFITGIFFGIGTLMSLFRNGVMVGTFQYFFVHYNLFGPSFITIWQHGTLEISSIIIAGSAGLTMSYGLLFPGTYTRMQALRISARRGLRIMMGITPIIIMAAFIEGFFTRLTEAPLIVRILLIVFSLGFILLYFVVYPRIVVRKYPEKIEIADKIDFADRSLPDLKGILNNEQLFGYTLKIVRIFSGKFLAMAFGTAIVAALFITAFTDELIHVSRGILNSSFGFKGFLNYVESPAMLAFNTLFYAVPVMLAMVVVKTAEETSQEFRLFRSFTFRMLLNAVIASAILNLLFFLNIAWAVLLLIIVFPFIHLTAFTSFYNNSWIPLNLPAALKLTGKSFGSLVLTYIKFIFLGFLLLLLIRPSNYWRFLNAIRSNLDLEYTTINHIFDFIISFIFYFSQFVLAYIVSLSINIYYFTASEVQHAKQLAERIQRIGSRKIIKGYEFE